MLAGLVVCPTCLPAQAVAACRRRSHPVEHRAVLRTHTLESVICCGVTRVRRHNASHQILCVHSTTPAPDSTLPIRSQFLEAASRSTMSKHNLYLCGSCSAG